jgi:hypothetical protein
MQLTKKLLSIAGILAIALVFVIAAASCNKSEGDCSRAGNSRNNSTPNLDSDLIGSWTHDEDGDEYTFSQDGTFSWQHRDEPVTGRWARVQGLPCGIDTLYSSFPI